jgi:D-Tyr-tRNAtyr deacylase
MLLVGIDENDEKTDADWLVQKILNLRIFGDEDETQSFCSGYSGRYYASASLP